MRYFILDTNVPLHNPRALYAFPQGTVVIPAMVIEELDGKKRELNQVGENARKVLGEIKHLRKGYEGKTSIGIPLSNGGSLMTEVNHTDLTVLQGKFFSLINDHKILAVVMNLKKEAEENLTEEQLEELEKVKKDFEVGLLTFDEYWEEYYGITGFLYTLVTNDTALGIKADMLMIDLKEYDEDRIERLEDVHKGYHDILVPNELVSKFYQEQELTLKELEPFIKESLGLEEEQDVNKYVFVQDFLKLKTSENESYKAVGRLLNVNGVKKLKHLVVIEEMEEAKKKGEAWKAPYGLTPRNLGQKMLMEVSLDPNVDLVIVLGGAGTGKTVSILACGLQQMESEKTYKKMLAARPIIPMGKDIGYMPGEKADKLRHWMQPIYDNLEFLLSNQYPGQKMSTSIIEQELANKNIEIEALTYMRGRTIPDSYNYFDEFQNATPHEGKSVVTRAGDGTKVVLSGDIYQIDHPYLDARNNALVYIIERMKQEENVAIISLEKTERSKLAEQAARLL